MENGAVPIMNSSQNLDVPAASLVCRVCLATNVKLFNVNDDKLNDFYMQLIAIYLLDHRLPHKVCWECAHKLKMYQSFKNKAIKSRDLLLSVVGSSEFLTLRCVQSIDRTLHGLKSSLKQETSTLIDIKINPDPESDIDLKKEIKDEIIIPIEFNEIKKEINEVDVNTADNFEDNIDDFKDSDDDTLLLEMTNKINMMRERGKLKKKSKETCDDNIKIKTVNNIDDIHDSDDTLWIERKNKIKIMSKRGRMKKTSKKTCDDKMETVKNTPVQTKSRRKVFVNPNLFTIQPLTHEEQIKEIANRQDSAAYKNAPFKCTTCFKGFPLKKHYEAHIVKHMEESGEHECFVCKIRCKTARALRKHIVDQHTEKYLCKKCPFVTKFRGVAMVHERWHSGSSFQCPHCPCQFDKKTTFDNHLRLKHASDFVCALCGFTFVSKKGVDAHVSKKHKSIDIRAPLEGPYCKVCDIKFMNEEAYKRHLTLISKHKNDDNSDLICNEKKTQQSITCEQCGIVLGGLRNYAQHFHRAHPDKKRTDFPEKIKNELNISKARAICEWCGRIYQCMALLKQHMWVHTGVKPFQCSLCGKSFTVKTTLIRHMRTHTEARPTYPCHVCGKRFLFHNNRKRHMFIHSGVKPHSCSTCGKCFTTTRELKAHVAHVHLKKPWPQRKRYRKPSISDEMD